MNAQISTKVCQLADLRAITDVYNEAVRTDYSENYISLLPGEINTVKVASECKSRIASLKNAHFEISGWNSAAQTIELSVKE